LGDDRSQPLKRLARFKTCALIAWMGTAGVDFRVAVLVGGLSFGGEGAGVIGATE
jgi:hypothetical protein